MTNPFWWAYQNPEAAVSNLALVLILIVPLILFTAWAFTSGAAYLNRRYKNRGTDDGWRVKYFPPLTWIGILAFEFVIVGIWVWILQFVWILFT